MKSSTKPSAIASLRRGALAATSVLMLLAACAMAQGEPVKEKGRAGTPTLKGAAEEKAKAREYEFTPDPRLPNVLLLGDSISIGYTLTVRQQLQGVANVFRPMTDSGLPENCCGTNYWFKYENLERWLRLQPKWDVIHFNAGLHDVMRLDMSLPRRQRPKTSSPNAPHQVPLNVYQRNLEKSVAMLRATGATLVFGTTTPTVPNLIPIMAPEDVVAYNEAAVAIMKKHQVAINDLHAQILPRLAELQFPANCHFREEGSVFLGETIAGVIRPMLPADATGSQSTSSKRAPGASGL